MAQVTTNPIEWIAVCGGVRWYDTPHYERGWWYVRFGLGSGARGEFGRYVTTVENPVRYSGGRSTGEIPPKASPSPTAAKLWQHVRPAYVKQEVERWYTKWPGFLIITTDGRAISIAAYDFWDDKGEPRSHYKALGDFIVRLVQSPRVAEIYDLPAKPPAGTVRAYSEEDVFLLLEHPELKLINLGKIASAAQQVNALRAQLAELKEEKAQLERQLAELSHQYAQAGFEAQEAASTRQEAERKLQEITERELELQRQLQQAQQVAASSRAGLWLALAGGAVLLVLLARR